MEVVCGDTVLVADPYDRMEVDTEMEVDEHVSGVGI